MPPPILYFSLFVVFHPLSLSLVPSAPPLRGRLPFPLISLSTTTPVRRPRSLFLPRANSATVATLPSRRRPALFVVAAYSIYCSASLGHGEWERERERSDIGDKWQTGKKPADAGDNLLTVDPWRDGRIRRTDAPPKDLSFPWFFVAFLEMGKMFCEWVEACVFPYIYE